MEANRVSVWRHGANPTPRVQQADLPPWAAARARWQSAAAGTVTISGMTEPMNGTGGIQVSIAGFWLRHDGRSAG
jgi:hypothetical protein